MCIIVFVPIVTLLLRRQNISQNRNSNYRTLLHMCIYPEKVKVLDFFLSPFHHKVICRKKNQKKRQKICFETHNFQV